MVHHYDVVGHDHGGADGETAAPGEILGPGSDAGPQLEGVEIDVAQGQHGRAEAILPRVVLLDDHAVGEKSADDAVHGGRRKVETLCDLAKAEPVAALENREDAQSAVDGLDHPATSSPCRLRPHRREVLRGARQKRTFDHHSTLSNSIPKV